MPLGSELRALDSARMMPNGWECDAEQGLPHGQSVLHDVIATRSAEGSAEPCSDEFRWERGPDVNTLDVINVDGLSRDELARRARQVEGWDRLAVIGPYGRGSELANQAAGLNPWLQLRLRATSGFPQDGMFEVLVIENGRVITTFVLEGCPFVGVLEHEP